MVWRDGLVDSTNYPDNQGGQGSFNNQAIPASLASYIMTQHAVTLGGYELDQSLKTQFPTGTAAIALTEEHTKVSNDDSKPYK